VVNESGANDAGLPALSKTCATSGALKAVLITALWLLPETTFMAVAGIYTNTVKVADTEPTVTCNVTVLPPGLVTVPVAVASPSTLVVALAPARIMDPDNTFQVAGIPGIGFLETSVTCTRNGAGKVAPASAT